MLLKDKNNHQYFKSVRKVLTATSYLLKCWHPCSSLFLLISTYYNCYTELTLYKYHSTDNFVDYFYRDSHEVHHKAMLMQAAWCPLCNYLKKNEGMLFSLKVYKCTGGKAGGSFEMSAALANAFLPLWELFTRLPPPFCSIILQCDWLYLETRWFLQDQINYIYFALHLKDHDYLSRNLI